PAGRAGLGWALRPASSRPGGCRWPLAALLRHAANRFAAYRRSIGVIVLGSDHDLSLGERSWSDPSIGLLARGTQVGDVHWMAAAPGVDVQAAAAGVARHDEKRLRLQHLPQVAIHTFHTMLVEFRVATERHDVLQQALVIDARTRIADLYATPVRLAGHRAVGFQQVAH